MDLPTYSPTPRTTLHRIPARGSYDRAVVHGILDEALVCHMGFVHEGTPVVIPTTFVRVGEELFVHGAVASRMLKTLAGGARACVTVTLVDGLVLARTAFHHSMNYRSVVILGTATLVEDAGMKRDVLMRLIEKLSPGRSSALRDPNMKELGATSLLSVPLEELSAKTRSGMPKDEDDPEDKVAPVWAGVVPVSLRAATAQPENEDAERYPLPHVPEVFRASS
jgi:nitroimidazol reductase NimA-like FMN-containing flavoprotein (pyridoxamine 5'-phosphate oxidase superfamily)